MLWVINRPKWKPHCTHKEGTRSAKVYIKCIYGRQECQVIRVGTCPREKKCPYGAKIRAIKLRKKSKKVAAQNSDRGDIKM